jgi:small subunit ribosomal protein S6
MREYDILFIMKPHLAEDVYSSIVESFEKWITDNEGEIDLLNAAGIKDLASTLSGFDQGYYVHCQFKGTNKTIDEINKRMKVNETIFRHLLVTLDSIQQKNQNVDEKVESEG